MAIEDMIECFHGIFSWLWVHGPNQQIPLNLVEWNSVVDVNKIKQRTQQSTKANPAEDQSKQQASETPERRTADKVVSNDQQTSQER